MSSFSKYLFTVLSLVLFAVAARAADSNEAQCAKGEAVYCWLQANTLHEAGHDDQATPFFEKACQLSKSSDNARGCLEFAQALQSGVGVARDRARALQIYAEQCDHEGAGCRYDFLQRLIDGKVGPAADPARAFNIARPMCDRDDGFACRIVMNAYKQGLGTAADPVKAAEAEKKLNRIVAALVAKSNDLMKDLKSQQAQRDKDEHDKALQDPTPYKKFDADCANGHLDACWQALPYFIFVDLKHAEELVARYYQGSEQVDGYSPWVAESARKLASYGKAQAGRDFVQAGCDAGILDACAVLGKLLATGEDGLAKELPRGKKVLNQACTQGSLAACAALFTAEPQEYARIQKQMQHAMKLKGDQDKKKAQAELDLEKLLTPYVVKLDALHEESEAQKHERFEPDRLPAAEFEEMHPDATPEDLAAAEAWRQRRAARQQEIKQLVESLRP